MILVDTSVWVDHLRRGNDELRRLLIDEQVLCQPFQQARVRGGELLDPDVLKHPQNGNLPRLVDKGVIGDDREI